MGYPATSARRRVHDLGEIPHGIPVPQLPDLRLLSFSLVTGALAVAAIVLVQGAGVSEAVPNDGGTPADAGRLAEAGGRLYLSGLDPSLIERLRRTGHLDSPVRAFEATAVVGESTHAAYLDAEAWLVTRHDE